MTKNGNSASAASPATRPFVRKIIVRRVCALVDAEDSPRLKGRWFLSPYGYAWRTRYVRYDRERHDDVNALETMHRVVLRLGRGSRFQPEHFRTCCSAMRHQTLDARLRFGIQTGKNLIFLF